MLNTFIAPSLFSFSRRDERKNDHDLKIPL
nr:MAG TPA: hypothetical protein [Caudoviricetes sp.]